MVADDPLKGELPAFSFTQMNAQKEFRVVSETEEHYVFQRADGSLGATEKNKVRVVTISGYIN